MKRRPAPALDRPTRLEFGDFQTPITLARDVCELLRARGLRPASVIEPTCGLGAFVRAAAEMFPGAQRIQGVDVNASSVDAARRELTDDRVEWSVGDFFDLDWSRRLAELPEPILVVGNPPWVTNATVGALGGTNLPPKSNRDRWRGIHAMTGRSNFDISEWMLAEILGWLERRRGTLAMLVKTTVARKVLARAWRAASPIVSASLHRIDAPRHFGASVDAGLLTMSFGSGTRALECECAESLDAERATRRLGWRSDRLIADVDAYDTHRHLIEGERGPGAPTWRSGIKHDCRAVFELSGAAGSRTNGAGDGVDIEEEVLFPLLKSSDLMRGRPPRRVLLVPQRSLTESPADLAPRAPRAWRYLERHADRLARRGSSIYRGRPPYSIFGVGEYSFAPWKVAIAGMARELRFTVVGPIDDRPVLFDDTCYFVPCPDGRTAHAIHGRVSSEPALAAWSSLMFWDAKRPVTAKLLNAVAWERIEEGVEPSRPWR
ncbi:MAG: SAM-dependent DNA methyltransferase [Planctomycetes bacterium]|nr:SAM-dependent DNA methyltransferase [Planctomycetota bacterium]